MNIETLPMLRNPYSEESLQLIYAENSDGVEEKFLEGLQSGMRFPFRNEIPVLFDESRLEGYNLKYNQFYRKSAKYYDPVMKSLALLFGGEARFRNEYLSLLEIEKGSKVLEVSIGTGTNISLLTDQADYYGVDLSWNMLNRCQKNLEAWGRTAELFYGNAECLPFHDEMFDVVFHVGGINAFSEREKALKELVRVAHSGTRIVVVDETSKVLAKLSWLSSAHKMLEEWGDRFNAPIDLLPENVREKKTELIIHGYFYYLSFRKV